MGDKGDDARTGDEDRGDGTLGRWSQTLEKMGVGAKDSMFSAV